jgi:Na+/H+-dicarboxylate symporter
VPASIVDGMAKNEILQIVIFSIFFGTGAAAVGARATPLIDAIDGAAHVMLKVTGYVMNFAPIAVFAAVASVIAKSGVGVLSTYGVFMAEFYLGIALLWIVLIAIGILFVGPRICSCCANCASRPSWPSPAPRRKRPSRKPWKAWSASA